ncbi:MAG: hypothetical protein JXB32_25370, partial [Deltaproteobacteria bacterium]|nr:hypothetical protein [Deltaproteobacteria bacterium]
MKRTLFGFLCLGLASPVVTSCREVQGTEVLIEVYTNRFAVEEITSVELEIIGVGSDQNPRDDRRCLHRETIELDAANAEGGFEFLFSVRPGDHCNDRVYAKATLYSGNYPLATGAGWQYFEEGSSHRLQISFLNTIECDTSSLWCDDECSEGQQSLEHCGWCGNECPEGARCDRGWCDCPDGGIDCDGKCTDTSKDWRNCGECWNECGPDEACVGGSCTSECPAGRDRCGHDCVDFQTNPEHCGGCGTPCIGICSGGTCDTGCVPRNGGICDPIEQCGCSAGQ